MEGLERRRWVSLVLGLPALHLAVHHMLALGGRAQLIWTDSLVLAASLAAVFNCLRTARRCRERHLCIAWGSITAGAILWWLGAATWTFRELVLEHQALPPSWLDAPFFALAPTFAIALIFYRHRLPSAALQIRQIADLGILTATIALVGTVVLAGPIREHGFTPYVLVAICYPGFYLAVVLFALQMLGRGHWGPRRKVLGILIWAHLAFASVDLLYGAQVIAGDYQTTGVVDTLWLLGFLSLSWAAANERAVREASDAPADRDTSWSAVVGGVTVVALAALSFDAITRLHGLEWTIAVIAGIAAAGFTALRMWTSSQTEEAYHCALAAGEQTTRALDAECTRTTRLRAVGSMATGTAHEVNNLIQAIGGSLALVRRRAARGEAIEPYLASAEQAVRRLTDEVHHLRSLAPSDRGRGTVLVLSAGDPDGQLSAALARAGFAPALLPDVDSVMRAVKGGGVRAVVATRADTADLELRQISVPIVAAGQDATHLVEELASAST